MDRREPPLRAARTSDGPADGPARFLRELRQLRKEAGLADTELAARAHYPCEAIRAAEAGPALPDLPVLSAYVRSCGGAVGEWEERWRTLTRSPALPLLSARTAGYSDAAAAGARIVTASPAADGHDPALIMAALSRVASGIAAEPARLSPAAPEVSAQAQPAPGTGSAVPADGGVGAGIGAGGGGGVLAPEPGSLFGDDPGLTVTAAGSPMPITPASGADHVLGTATGGLAPWDIADAVPAANGSRAPSAASAAPVASPAPAPGGAVPTRRALRSKPAIAAVIVLLCLVAVLVALLSLRSRARSIGLVTLCPLRTPVEERGLRGSGGRDHGSSKGLQSKFRSGRLIFVSLFALFAPELSDSRGEK